MLIDIPKNVAEEAAEYEPLTRHEHGTTGHLGQLMKRSSQNFRAPEPDHGDIDRLADMIRASKKPLVICGGGVVRSRANWEFEEFANRIDAPVGITVMGAGGFRGLNKLATGLVGMHGSQASNMAVDACDLLIAVGCRFSDRVALKPSSFARNAQVVQIDIDRSEINKNVETAHHIIGDARRVLQLLNERMEQLDHAEWKDYVFSFKTQTEYDEADDRMTPVQVLDAIARNAPRDAIYATDVGQHQMWAIQHLHFEYSGQLVTSGGFGTMGFGLGAAIGAQVGNPDKLVVHITGDGSFRMNCNELATVEHYGLPIVTVLFNNGALGMVRQWQTLTCGGRYSQTTLDRGPDFVKLAEAYGLAGRRVTNVGGLRSGAPGALDQRPRQRDRLRHRHRRDGAAHGGRRQRHHRFHGGLRGGTVMNTSITRHTLAVLVDNEAGVLSRVARLFSGKGYNIESLAVGATHDPAMSRITIEVITDERQARLICNQLRKLICVHSVKRLSAERAIRRELVLIKVSAPTHEARNEIIQIANIFRASIIDVATESMTIALIGDDSKAEAIQNLLSEFGILELVRTGTVALERGQYTIDEQTKEKGEFDYGKNVLSPPPPGNATPKKTERRNYG